MHVMIGLTMGMYLFALIMIVLNVAAFGPGVFRTEREGIARFVGIYPIISVPATHRSSQSEGLRATDPSRDEEAADHN